MPAWRTITFWLVVLAAALTAATGRADDAGEPAAAVEPDADKPIALSQTRIEHLWRLNWRKYAARCAMVDGRLLCCARFDKRYDSSRHVTVDILISRSTRQVKVPFMPNMVRPVDVTIPRADAKAGARSLPKLEPGHYGHIHSVSVSEVTGENTMLVRDVWLIDADDVSDDKQAALRKLRGKKNLSSDQRKQARELVDERFQVRDYLVDQQREFRRTKLMLWGFETRLARPKKRWDNDSKGKGVQIAIVGKLEPKRRRESTSKSSKFRRRRDATLVAVPAAWFDKKLTEPQFRDLLEQRGYSVEQFVKLTVRRIREDSKRVVERVLNEIFNDMQYRFTPPESESEEEDDESAEESLDDN